MEEAELQKCMAMAKQLGYEGKELQDFIRDERAIYREEKKYAQMEKEKEREREEQKEQREREERQREREREEQKEQRECEEREKTREYELEMARLRYGSSSDEQPLNSTSVLCYSRGMSEARHSMVKLPPFEEEKDNIESYLCRFEKYHSIVKTDPSEWAISLAALLRGKSLDVFSRLADHEVCDYEALKNALLRRYSLTEEGLKKKFYTCKPETGEGCSQFMVRLSDQLNKWICATKIKQNYEQLFNLLVKEQFLYICERNLAAMLREKDFDNLTDMAKSAERYGDAHGGIFARQFKPNYSEGRNEERKTTESEFYKEQEKK